MRVREMKALGIYSPISIFPQIDENERWLPVTDQVVPYVKKYYYVSTYGRVGAEKTVGFKLLTPILQHNGYYYITLPLENGNITRIGVHRLEMLVFCPIPNSSEMQVNHIDGDKHNNYIGNLEWCTPRENIIHAHLNGLCHHKSGEDVGTAKITNEQANEIGRLLAERKLTHREIAETIGCSEDIVKSISNGSCWKEVHDKYNLGERFSYKANDRFTPEEIKFICQYFQDNAKIFKSKAELFRNCYMTLYGTDQVSRADSNKLYYIYRREKYTAISSNYIW